MNATHGLCDCCPTTTEYIRQHLDPEGLTRSTDDPEETLATFDACFADEGGSGMTVLEVQIYLDALREEGK
jgi:hypothetical protein